MREPVETLLEDALQRRADAVRSVRVRVTASGRPRPAGRGLAGGVALVAAVAVAVVLVTVTHRPTGTPHPVAPPAAAATVPSVIGLDAADAQVRLRDLGLVVVRRVPASGCGGPGRTGVGLGTAPPVGSRVEAGTQVVLQLSSVDRRFCAPDAGVAWSLLRFAVGAAGPPALGPKVDLSYGSAHRTLDARDAADPAHWLVCSSAGCGSALATLEGETQRAPAGPPPYLRTIRGPGGRVAVGLAAAMNDIDLPTSVSFTVDGRGRIDSVALDARATGRRAVRGVLEMTGGPYGSSPTRVRSGRVALVGPVSVTVGVRPDGSWVAHLPSGRYTVRGRTVQYNDGGADCGGPPVTVGSGQVDHVVVACIRR